jgi:hypothetical protein
MLMAIFFMLLPVTGVLLHEWLGAGLVAAVFIHLALNHRWIAGVARRFKSAGTRRKAGSCSIPRSPSRQAPAS